MIMKPIKQTFKRNTSRIAKKKLSKHRELGTESPFTIIEVAKMFNCKIKYLKARPGERYASALTNMNLSNKVYKLFGKIQLKDYLKKIIK